MIRANLADGRVLQFPDGTDPTVIQNTVKKMISAPGKQMDPGVDNFELQRGGIGDIKPEENTQEISTLTAPQTGQDQADISDPDLEWKNVLTDSLKNTPSSAFNFGKDILNTIMHPIQTAEAIGGLAVGAAQKLVPGEQPQEQNIDLMVDFLKDRYGSIEKLKKTIAKDPVGVLADASSFVIPGGAALKGAGAATKINALTKLGQAASKAGTLIEPLSALKKSVGLASPLIPKNLPSELYRSAAKFSTVIPENVRASLTKTALDNKIMPTIAGVDKLRTKINVINKEITDLIDTATSNGKTIPIKRLFAGFKELRRDAALSGEPITQQRAINSIAKQITEANKKIGRNSLTPQQAQKLKQNIYKETESLYSKATQAPVKGRVKQEVARAAKEALEGIFPEIKNLNAKEGSMLALLKEIEKSSSRISNRDLLGIGVPIKGGAGGTIAGVPGLVGGLAVGLFDTPQVKAKLAIALNEVRNKGFKINPGSAAFRLGIIAPTRVGIVNEGEE